MGSQLSKVTYQGWPGGLNLLADKLQVMPIQLTEAKNVLLMTNGVVATRPGVTSLNSLYQFFDVLSIWNGKANKYCYHSSDGTLRDGGGNVLKTYVHAGAYYGQFVFFNNTLLHCNGYDIMQQWDCLAANTSDVAGSPFTTMLIKHNDRIFGAAGSVLYETSVNTATDWAGGAVWNIGINEGGDITGLASLNSDLYIFKYNRIYRMTGYATTERVIGLYAKDIGTVEPYSIQTVNLTGLGQAIVFLSTDKRLMVMTLTMNGNIGECIQPLLDTVAISEGPARCQSAISVLHRQYMLSFPATGTNLKKTCLCLHYESAYKSQYGTRWGITQYQAGIEPQNAPVTFQAISESIDYDVIFASLAVTITGAYNLYYFDPTASGDGNDKMVGSRVPIASSFRTRDEDCGNHDKLKQFRRTMLRMSSSAGSAVSLAVNFYQYVDEKILAQTTGESPSSDVNVAWGDIFDYWIDLVNSAKHCALRFDMSQNTAPFSAFRIAAIEIFYKPSASENRP